MAQLVHLSGHPAGLCGVAYLEADGQVHLISCGKDGKLCYRSASNPSEVIKSILTHNEGEDPSPLTCVAASPSGDCVSVADEKNFVKIFKFPSGDLHTTATRFSLPARFLAYSPSGLHLAASGDDEGIKLIDLAGNKVFRTLRSDAYTRGLAFDPEGDYLASASADGTLTVWSMTTGKVEFVKKRACSKLDPMAPARLTPAWHPDGGSFLAAPAADGSITFYERLSWDDAGELAGQHSSAAQVLNFSKNGLYLASAAADQTVVVWDVVGRSALQKTSLAGAACGLVWHPTENELAIATEDGQIVVWKSPVPASLPGPTEDVDALTGVTKRDKSDNPLIDDKAGEAGSDDGDLSMDDEYDKEDSFLADDENLPDSSRHRDRPRGHRRSRLYNSGRGGFKPMSGYADASSFSVLDLPQPQAPIQPGSTQLDAGRRYLAYNSLGAITLRSESDHNVVEVGFHDTSRVRRRVPLLSDFFGFTLGALGARGALYASKSSSDAPSTVVYRPFESWAPNSEWSMGLPEGEEAEGLATGTSFCAVATSKRLLRVFSHAGLQIGVFTLPGALIALAASGRALAVAWHAAPPTPTGDQSAWLSVFDIAEQRLLNQGPLPLSPGATLSWMGYSEEGILASYDSEGVLRFRSGDFGGSWVPVFSASAERKGGEHFWVFAVSLRAKEVQCIVCANAPEPSVPSGSARPVVTAAPLRIPVVGHDESVAPLEADILAQAITIAQGGTEESAAVTVDGTEAAELEAALHAAQVESDRAALRLFTRLAQSNRLARALEVAAGMQTDVGLEGALKIANHQRLSALAEQVETLVERRAVNDADVAGAGLAEGGTYGMNRQMVNQEEAPGAAIVPPPSSVCRGQVSVDEGEEAENSQPAAFALAHVPRPPGQGGSKPAGVAPKDGGPKRKIAAGNPFARKKTNTKS